MYCVNMMLLQRTHALSFLSLFSFIEHNHSDYCFAWHYHYGTAKFDSGKLYKVARSIIASNKPGLKRLSHILQLLGKN